MLIRKQSLSNKTDSKKCIFNSFDVFKKICRVAIENYSLYELVLRGIPLNISFIKKVELED